MYPNLRAEMARRNLTQTFLAEHTGMTVQMMCLKLNGKSPLTVDLAKRIKAVIGTDLPLEVLFAEEV